MVGSVPKLVSYCTANSNEIKTLLMLPLSYCPIYYKIMPDSWTSLRTFYFCIVLSLFTLQLCTSIALVSHIQHLISFLVPCLL